jgi:hypothetical protein
MRSRSSPKVRSWLAQLSDRDFGRVDFLVGLLAGHAEDLGEPYTRHLAGKVRELRFHLLRQQTRVTYWLAPDLLASTGTSGDLTDRVPQDSPGPDSGGGSRLGGAKAL